MTYKRQTKFEYAGIEIDAMPNLLELDDMKPVWSAYTRFCEYVRIKGADLSQYKHPDFSGLEKVIYRDLCNYSFRLIMNQWEKNDTLAGNRGTGTTDDDKSRQTSTIDSNINNPSTNPSNDPFIHPPIHPSNSIPALEEVISYAVEKGYGQEAAKRFFEAKEADGWKINGDPIKNWKALLDSWHKAKKVPAQQYTQRPYTEEDFLTHDQELIKEAESGGYDG